MVSVNNIPEVWTDATPHRIAVVFGQTVLMAELNREVDIALAEAMAAAWGLVINDYRAHLFIDNLGVAHVFAKGHSKSSLVNVVLFNIFASTVHGSVTWVPTEDQVADGPTRNSCPNSTVSQPDRWLSIRSTIFTEDRVTSTGTGEK